MFLYTTEEYDGTDDIYGTNNSWGDHISLSLRIESGGVIKHFQARTIHIFYPVHFKNALKLCDSLCVPGRHVVGWCWPRIQNSGKWSWDHFQRVCRVHWPSPRSDLGFQCQWPFPKPPQSCLHKKLQLMTPCIEAKANALSQFISHSRKRLVLKCCVLTAARTVSAADV